VLKHCVGDQKPFNFPATLTNAKPKGEINATEGSFGPHWSIRRSTPHSLIPSPGQISSQFRTTPVQIDPFPLLRFPCLILALADTLSSTGEYTGHLDQLKCNGELKPITPNSTSGACGSRTLRTACTLNVASPPSTAPPATPTLPSSPRTSLQSSSSPRQSHSRFRQTPRPQYFLSISTLPTPDSKTFFRLATKSTQPVMMQPVNLESKMLPPILTRQGIKSVTLFPTPPQSFDGNFLCPRQHDYAEFARIRTVPAHSARVPSVLHTRSLSPQLQCDHEHSTQRPAVN